MIFLHPPSKVWVSKSMIKIDVSQRSKSMESNVPYAGTLMTTKSVIWNKK